MTGDRFAASPAEVERVTTLLGRVPQSAFSVVCVDADGSPSVIENFPLLDDGTPMPTLYWLVDPALSSKVGRLESLGGVRAAERAIPAAAIEATHARYEAMRDALIADDHVGPRPSGGVGGTARGVKCLHAHLANFLAGHDDPVGAWTYAHLEVTTLDEEQMTALAALDCGTNSTRLLIVSRDGQVLDRQMTITRLGAGVDATGELSDAGIERVLAALRSYRALMDQHKVTSARLVCTSAVRDARNGPQFLERASSVVGVRAELLSGAEEAALSFVGATSDLSQSDAGDVVIDIGGGSTEIVVGGPTLSSCSLQLGCVRITERHLHSDPPTPQELAAARADIARGLDEAVEKVKALGTLAPNTRVIGLAGTVAALIMVDRKVADYDRSLVHGQFCSAAAVSSWCATLAGETVAERLARPGMEPGRADVLVGGLLVLDAFLERFKLSGVTSSESDILDGLIAAQRS